jgi:hypothetical protein
MTDQLESDLRTTLRERAAQVPATSIARLTRLDYRPRTRGLTPPLAIGALAGTAGAAGAVIALVSLGAGASNAFAGWTPAPTPPSPAQLAAAMVDCKAKSPIAGLPLKLTDTRGPFTFAIYANSDSSATCISGPSFTAVRGSVSSAPENIAAGHVALSTSHMINRDRQAYSFAEGHTGAGVNGITLILDDGTDVQATVANGWFVAWWPGAHEVKAADITTPAGVRTQTFDLNHESPCGAQLCTGGGAGLGSNGPVTDQAAGASLSGSSSSSSSGSSSGSGAGHGKRVESYTLSR